MYKILICLYALLLGSAYSKPMYIYCTNGNDWEWLTENGSYVRHYHYPQKIAHIRAVRIELPYYKRLSKMCNKMKKGWFPQVSFSSIGDWYVFWYTDRYHRVHITKGIATNKGKG